MAGYRLARLGHQVLLLEKASFPRQKPCGGALSPKAYRQLDFDISDLVKARVRRALLKGPGKSPVVLECGEAEVWMVCRHELDQRLLEQASQAGVVVRQGEPALALRDGGRVVVTAAGEYQSQVLVGADGYASLVAKSLGLDGGRRWLRTLCLEVPFPGQGRDEAVLDLAVPGGYAWLFPKGELVNVGVCAGSGGGSLRAGLESFLRREGLSLDCAHAYGSRPIPLGGSFRPLHQGNALLVGDAAGLADPLFGEGIPYALMSAQLAAAAIDGFLKGESPDLASYSKAIRRTLHRDLRALALGASLLYRVPRLFLALFRNSPQLRALALHILSGRRSPSGIWTSRGASPSSM